MASPLPCSAHPPQWRDPGTRRQMTANDNDLLKCCGLLWLNYWAQCEAEPNGIMDSKPLTLHILIIPLTPS